MSNKLQKISQLNKDSQADELSIILTENGSDLVHVHNSELIATTNAHGWGIDEIIVDNQDFIVNSDEASGKASFILAGDHDEEGDKGFGGDRISGTCRFHIDHNLVVTFKDIDAEIDDYSN